MSSSIDSLQDICIFYCVSHIDKLAALLRYYRESSDEASTSFSMVLENRILEYYLKCHIAEDSEQTHFDEVLNNLNSSNALVVNRKGILSADNVSSLAQNVIKVIEFTCYDDYKFLQEELETLVLNNLKHICKLKIKQKSTECEIEGLIQLLSGGDELEKKHKCGGIMEHDKNDNHSKEKKSKTCLRYLSKLGKFDKKDKVKDKSAHSCTHDDKMANKSSTSKAQTSGLISTPDDTQQTDSETSSKHSKHCERTIPNLVSFHYNMCYSSLENLTNSYAVFDGLCCIIEKNTQLQSITIVSVMPNPCKWFLLNTDMVNKLENLHSLVLSHATKKNMDFTGLGSVLFSKLPQLKRLQNVRYQTLREDFKLGLCCIIEKNTQLQSITIVSVMPNPCKWFLLNTDMVNKLENLHSLVLSHATKKNMDFTGLGSVLFSKLPQLKKLRHLDLSYGFEDTTGTSQMKYSDAEVTMFGEALLKMPNLKSIDISGSNLCNIIRHADGSSDSECKDHCMPGFEGRMFEYIGLFNCEPCCHKYIPALKVSGNTNEEQLLVAVWSYHHNQMIMSRLLSELRYIVAVEDSNVKQGLAFIEGLAVYLEELGDWDAKYTEAKHLELKNIHLTLINLFYLLRSSEVKTNMSIKTKRVLVERMLVMLKNALDDVNLAVLGYADPHVVYCHKFESYMRMLLCVLHSRAKHNVKMLTLSCIHSAVRHSQKYKTICGVKLELVRILLEDISASMTYNPTNEQREREGKMWSILWSLTDDVPVNCEKFVNHSGCSIAQDMIKSQPQNTDLLRKITGALSNVSENLHLHPYLMTEELVTLMRKLLLPFEDESYDISSHAAAYLVLLAALGPDTWGLQTPTHTEILESVDSVIQKWDINESKGVRFRTLVPMLTQIANTSCPVAQKWGAWMICNLVITKPDGYCSMLVTEKGLTIIDTALHQPDVRDDVKDLLNKIVNLTREYTEGVYEFIA